MDLTIFNCVSPGRSNGGIPKPHKYALLLAIAELFAKNPDRQNVIMIDSELEALFENQFRRLAPDVSFTPAMIEAPFYHLETSLWTLHIKNGMDDEYKDIVDNHQSRFTKKRILQVFSHASISLDLVELFRKLDSRRAACKRIETIFLDLTKKSSIKHFSRLESPSDQTTVQNPFVGYLNSLQRSGGSNENSLAESQACNAQFASIHVSHPLTNTILKELTGAVGHHVILTGHAGDGKSTVALEVFKRLSGLADSAPLESPLKPQEDVGAVSIIKDLSERAKQDDPTLLQELRQSGRRFLIISNTGTLLDLVKRNATIFKRDALTLETEVLKAIGEDTGESTLSLGEGFNFRVFNLALIDNLGLAKKILERMIAPEHWSECATRDCSKTCPIYINVDLMQQNRQLILERIFLAYRRMYEYGTRLTMRQFTEHLSYMITAGLQSNDIHILQKKSKTPLISEFLFFNRFFGDNGHIEDDAALQMKAVREIRSQGFGDRPLPRWEHRLWLRSCSTPVSLGVSTLDDEFEKLRRHGAHAEKLEGMTRSEAREQVRRMLFFLHGFSEESREYLGQYLNSPALLSWMSWQQPDAVLSFNDRTSFDQKIYHVLQEHFTGVRLPEGSTQSDRRLYVTLSRRRSEVRQSAQVVLAQIDWESSVQLELSEMKSAAGDWRQDLILRGMGVIADVTLPLGVPFLDYVMMRHFGELGEVLDPSYRERLDRFKAQVHNLAREADKEGMMLVRLRTDHTFRRQYFSVGEHGLEVRDV